MTQDIFIDYLHRVQRIVSAMSDNENDELSSVNQLVEQLPILAENYADRMISQLSLQENIGTASQSYCSDLAAKISLLMKQETDVPHLKEITSLLAMDKKFLIRILEIGMGIIRF
ncbi:hypothetical protein [Stenoxybacter acetivorans]|uniref:hypothetical protein n=1 Tax=Stenoxybacter acetivorans TaxID=422441 RepID=UPI00055B5F19|nr:hypothetical protein [Stenoxybacter acetivorans]